jgi:predicted neutral ceramidase superfamily lipid hydrolase
MCMSFFNIMLQLTHFNKDEQIMRILSTPTLIQESQSQKMCIHDAKEEIAVQCHDMFDQMQDRLEHIQSSFGKQQQDTQRTLRSFQSRQMERDISYAGLASRLDQIDDERDILKGDVWSIKNDVDSECHL